MNMLAAGKVNGSDLFRGGFVRHLIVCMTLMTITLTIKPALAAPEEEVRATFDRFVAAQNEHDIKAVESLLLGHQTFSGLRAVPRSGGMMLRSNGSKRYMTERGFSIQSRQV